MPFPLTAFQPLKSYTENKDRQGYPLAGQHEGTRNSQPIAEQESQKLSDIPVPPSAKEQGEQITKAGEKQLGHQAAEGQTAAEHIAEAQTAGDQTTGAAIAGGKTAGDQTAGMSPAESEEWLRQQEIKEQLLREAELRTRLQQREEQRAAEEAITGHRVAEQAIAGHSAAEQTIAGHSAAELSVAEQRGAHQGTPAAEEQKDNGDKREGTENMPPGGENGK